MRHTEFIHTAHFEENYHRYYVQGPLSLFIEYFWQTRFDYLWKQYPGGFSDALFPNLGYTYLINLGTPYRMQVNHTQTTVKNNVFLPRHYHIECFHQKDNCLFGIKFRVSPVLFEKKINFSEYNDKIFPLSYLMETELLQQVKKADSFEERVRLLELYYAAVIHQTGVSMEAVRIVTSLLQQTLEQQDFITPLEERAIAIGISTRTLHRYFNQCTGVSTKKALQVLRIRRAVAQIIQEPQVFDYRRYGYYDYSHFYKHLRQFLQSDNLQDIKPHLELLRKLKGG
jgi:AraC-like DNA-binding protein